MDVCDEHPAVNRVITRPVRPSECVQNEGVLATKGVDEQKLSDMSRMSDEL